MSNAQPQSGNSFDGNIANEVESVLAELTADDGMLHAAVVIRDKQRPYDPPTTLRVFDLSEIKDFVDNIPNQVHVLLIKKDDKSAILKVSLSSKKTRYNVHCVDTSIVSNEFDVELFKGISHKMEPELWQDLFKFLGGSEDDGKMSQEDFDFLISEMSA